MIYEHRIKYAKQEYVLKEEIIMVDFKDEDARKDLERIEEEVVAEAEASVEDFDALGDEQAAAEAAETAQTFEEAAKNN